MNSRSPESTKNVTIVAYVKGDDLLHFLSVARKSKITYCLNSILYDEAKDTFRLEYPNCENWEVFIKNWGDA